MMKLRGLGVAAVFLAGCAVGGASGRLVVPPAGAQQAKHIPPPGATRWDQMCVTVEGEAEQVSQVVMAYGNDYWELVSASVTPRAVLMCFKRPKA